MKVRSGFVSNSSTSSFVLLGFLVEETKFTEAGIKQQLEIKYGGENQDVRVYDADYYGPGENGEEKPVPDGQILVGLQISDIECYGTTLKVLGAEIPRMLALQTKLGVSMETHPLVMLHYLTNQ